MILEWLSTYNLTLLNMDDKCIGTTTWSRECKNQKSTVDFVLVNNNLYKKFVGMKIDEDKDEIDISDHHLITVTLNFENNNNKFNKKQYTITEYYTNDIEALIRFKNEVEERWTRTKVNNIKEMDESLVECANIILKRLHKRRVGTENDEKVLEKPWFTEEIRSEIKKKRDLNRKKRNCKNIEEKEILTREWKAQKEKAQLAIRQAIEQYEIKLTNDIKSKGNKGKLLWENINKLIGKETRKVGNVIYDSNGKALCSELAKERILEFWRGLYSQYINNIDLIWNEKVKQDLYMQFERERAWNMNILREHLDMAYEIEEVIRPMEMSVLDSTVIKEDINKLKNKKGAGPNKLKAEIYKKVAESELCLNVMTECFSNEIANKDKPEGWRSSRTILIPKINKPTEKDLRPIAVTDVSYKLYMTNVKREFENHLIRNNLVKDNQIGFTQGGRLEYSHFIIQFLVEKAYINKNSLILVSIDFKKAFDSIDRAKLIETLIKYKIHPDIIDAIAQVYKGDYTFLDFEDNSREKIEITSGIRQGCPISATLFKLVTYEIMNKLEKEGAQYEVNNIRINSMFYADDSILIAKNIEDASRNIKILIEVSAIFGLHINKNKSNIIIYNHNKK